MTLTISVRVPDGIVLAADSLTTVVAQLKQKGELGLKCPKCNTEIKIPELPMPPISMPAGGSLYGQKLFNIKKENVDVGVAIFGNAFLTGRTVESHVREFEKKKIVGSETVTETAEKFKEYFQNELVKEAKGIENIKDGVIPLGFQVVGYEKEDVMGKIFLIKLGKTPTTETKEGYTCVWAGDGRVVDKLWGGGGMPIPKPSYRLLPLQDAIDYAIFLINTTIQYQRFATMIPTCGGNIDVAVITHHGGFEWAQSKKLWGEKNIGETL